MYLFKVKVFTINNQLTFLALADELEHQYIHNVGSTLFKPQVICLVNNTDAGSIMEQA